jgi:hypothetical protein
MDIHDAWSNFNIGIAIGILIAYIIVDGMYAYYTQQVAKNNPLSAATTGALMHFLLALGVLSYVENYLYLIPLAVGSWIGTFIVVRREQRNEVNSKKL